MGILFEEEDEVAVPTNQPEPSYDDIEEISLEEVDRILQQKGASSGASNNAVLEQPSIQPSPHPYLITAEMAHRLVGADIDHSSAAASANRNAAANESQTSQLNRRQPKAKRGVPQEGLKTIDPSELDYYGFF